MNFSHLANKLRSKITKFSGILSKDLDKTAQRFVREAMYGIMASQSVMLTEIGRQLESSLSLKKIEERFSRQLIKPRIWDRLHERILSLASSRVKDRTLLILDLSDLKKKYAEKIVPSRPNAPGNVSRNQTRRSPRYQTQGRERWKLAGRCRDRD